MKGILWVNVPSDLVPARFGHVPHAHVTLKFGVNLNDFSSLLGRQVDVRVVADCWSDDLGVQALRVVLPADLPCDNRHPHVTVSLRDGVKPVTSNVMLAGDHHSRDVDMVVTGVVDQFVF